MISQTFLIIGVVLISIGFSRMYFTKDNSKIIYRYIPRSFKEDQENQNMRKAIKHISNKNIRMLNIFKEKHPDCLKSESKFSDQYNKIVIEAFGGAGDNELEKENKIIKKIAKEVTI
jgi:hypothetical protein